MAKLVICRGLPASGKTTFAKKSGMVVVCKDDLREAMGNRSWNYDVEREVLRQRDFLISQALSSGKDVCSADTNLNPKHEAKLRAIAAKYKATVEVKSFLDVPLDECIRRNSLRESPIHEDVIRNMHDRYLAASDGKCSCCGTVDKS